MAPVTCHALVAQLTTLTGVSLVSRASRMLGSRSSTNVYQVSTQCLGAFSVSFPRIQRTGENSKIFHLLEISKIVSFVVFVVNKTIMRTRTEGA
jgi:hypothetical protein